MLAGVLRSELVTVHFDEQGNGVSAVIRQDKILKFAEQLGLYNPPSPVARMSRVRAVSEESLVSMHVGVEVDLNVNNLSIELTRLVYDPATGSLTVDLLFRVRDSAGVEVSRKSVQIVIGGITADSDGAINAASVEVVGYDNAGNQVFRENLGAAGLNQVGENTAPQAAAKAIPADCKGMETVILSAAGSADPDGDALTYHWAQSGEPAVTLTGADTAKATFQAPDVAGDTVLTFVLTVNDGSALSTATTTVTVHRANHAPLAKAGNPQTVVAGQLVSLDASASSDPDGDALTFTWQPRSATPPATLGNPNAAATTFTAPEVTQETIYEFDLTVSDGALSATDVARVVVEPGAGTSLLKLVPGDVTMLAAIKNLTDLFAGVDEVTGVSDSILELLPLPEDFDVTLLDCGVAVLYRLSDQTGALIIGLSQEDLSTLIGVLAEMPLDITDAADGVTKISMDYGYGYTQDFYLGQPGEGAFTIAALSKEAVIAVRDRSQSVLERFDSAWLTAFNARQLVLYTDGTIPPLGMGMPLPMLVAGESLDVPRMPDTEAMCVIAGIGDPLALTVWQRFAANTPSLEALQKMSVFTGSALKGLPNEPILSASATRGSSMAMLSSVLLGAPMPGGLPIGLLGALQPIGAASEPDPITAAIQTMTDLTRQEATSFSELAGGSDGYIGYASVLEVSDGNDQTDDADTYIAVVQGLSSEVLQMIENLLGPHGAGLIVARELDDYVAGRIVYQWSVDLAAVSAATNIPLTEYLPMVAAVLGSEPLTLNLVKVDSNHVAVSAGGGAARLTQIVNSAVAGTAPLADRPMIAAAASQMVSTRANEFYLAPGQVSKLYYDISVVLSTFGAVDAPTEPDPGHATSAIGVASGRDGNSARFDVVVPVDSLKGFSSIFELIGGGYGLGPMEMLFMVLGGVAM